MVVPVIWPAEALILLAEKTFGFGRPKLVLFVMLKNSARNSTLVLSWIGIVLNTEKSNSARPGPSALPGPRFPRYTLRLLAYPESEVDHFLSAHGERNSASDLSLKARLLALHCIIAHGQNGNNVTAPPRR